MAKQKKASAKKAASASAGVKKTAKKKSGQAATKKKAPVKNKTAAKKKAGRELIDTGADKRFVRRDDQGQFQESDDVGRSLAQDRRKKAKRKAESGQGDRGDR